MFRAVRRIAKKLLKEHPDNKDIKQADKFFKQGQKELLKLDKEIWEDE